VEQDRVVNSLIQAADALLQLSKYATEQNRSKRISIGRSALVDLHGLAPIRAKLRSPKFRGAKLYQAPDLMSLDQG
jgi:hypothetical protein